MASRREQASKSAYLLPSEVAEVLQVSPKTVTRWAKEGKLASRRTLGGHRGTVASGDHCPRRPPPEL